MKHIKTCILTVTAKHLHLTKLNGIFKRFSVNTNLLNGRIWSKNELHHFAIASLKPLALSNYNISQNTISMNKSLNFCHLKITIKSFNIDVLCSWIWFVFPQKQYMKIPIPRITQSMKYRKYLKQIENKFYTQLFASPHQGQIYDF